MTVQPGSALTHYGLGERQSLLKLAQGDMGFGAQSAYLALLGVSGAFWAALRAGEAGGAGGVTWMIGGASLAARCSRGPWLCLSGAS